MILRSFLLFIFLFQMGLSPVLASDYVQHKFHAEKHDSKSKPVKSDVSEEVDDEEESKKDLTSPVTVFNRNTCEFQCKYFENEHTPVNRISIRLYHNTPIFLWVQNFRI